MKRLTLLFALLITLSCSITNAANNTVKEDKNGKVEVMTDAMFKENVFDLDANIKEWKYKGTKPLIIDLYATWCGPCKEIAPILEELAEEYNGKVLFYKVDVDKNKKITKFFNVSAIPFLVFIPSSGEPQYMMGSKTKNDYKEAIEKFLLK